MQYRCDAVLRLVDFRQRFGNCFFEHRDLLVGQFGKLLALLFRKLPGVLHAEADEQRRFSVRHINLIRHRGVRPVELLDELDFFPEVGGYGFRKLIVKVFDETGRIEIPVEVSGLVQDLDFVLRRHLVFDVREKGGRVAFERRLILLDVAQDRRRDRKDDALGRVVLGRQHVMNEETVDTAVSVLERMDEDET